MTARQMIAKIQENMVKAERYTVQTWKSHGVLTKGSCFQEKYVLWNFAVFVNRKYYFLGATYVTENTKTNNELTFKADDGLASDIQIYEVSDQLTDMIPENMVKEWKMSQVLSLYIRYVICWGKFH